jgi:enoyl-CoA hydratase/carnithine racemase
MPENEPITLKIEDRVAHVILDAPPDNRMNSRFFACLKEILQQIKAADGVNAAVVYSGGRHFSAGADVRDITENVYRAYTEGKCPDVIVKEYALIFREIECMHIPVIAAVTGICTGSGLELALACNMRICSADALLGCPELSWGIITGLNGSIRLEKTIGRSKALEVILTGDLVTARDAYRIGLVDKLLPKKEVLPYTLELAGRSMQIAKNNIVMNSNK